MENTVWVHLPAEGRRLEARTGDNLLEVLRGAGVGIPAVCAGRGTCGKCRVKADGRETLACTVTLEGDIAVEVCGGEAGFAILGGQAGASPHGDSEYGIAVDIGTTTVVLQLIGLRSGRAAASLSFVNGQRPYGADVISRIQLADEGGKLDLLCGIITGQIDEGVRRLCETAGVAPASVRRVTVAGNTTMIHLLLRLPCRSLGQYPFTPEHSLEPEYRYGRVFGGDTLDCTVRIIPWISAFVGGDITAGILSCRRGAEDQTCLLVDMGTNGEMALWSGGSVLCTSTAAGPAFEGGNIAFGTGGITGAISAVDFLDGSFRTATIGDAPPVGICGSGVLDTAACLVRHGFVDENGLLEDEYFDSGVTVAHTLNGEPILFTQKDVRELQLAKSAVRAGIEILLSEQGISYSDVDRVFLAGGFGQNLRLESAVAIGLLPAGLAGGAVPCGNTSLRGCALLCADPGKMDVVQGIVNEARELNLSAHRDFNDLFMEHMSFE